MRAFLLLLFIICVQRLSRLHRMHIEKFLDLKSKANFNCLKLAFFPSGQQGAAPLVATRSHFVETKRIYDLSRHFSLSGLVPALAHHVLLHPSLTFGLNIQCETLVIEKKLKFYNFKYKNLAK